MSAVAAEAGYWSLFVQYPNHEPVLRELLPPQSLAELRDALEVFDDQHLLVVDEPRGELVPVERIAQIRDGVCLQVAVPRRRIYVSRHDGAVRQKPIVWYPGAGADQIEGAIVKACGLPIGTPIELLDGQDAVVISATIPNETALTVVPLLPEGGSVGFRANGGSVATNGSGRLDHADRRRQPESPRTRGGPSRSATTPSGPRAAKPRAVGASAVGSVPRGVHSAGGHSGSGGGGDAVGSGIAAVPAGSGYGHRSATPQNGAVGTASGGRASSPGRGGYQPEALVADAAAAPGQSCSGSSARDEHCVHILMGHGGPVLSLCTVGDVLFSGSQDCNIMIWDLNNFQYIGTLPGHTGVVKCMAATLARKMLCSGSQDKTIRIWSLETFSSTKTLTGHTSEVNSLAIFEGADFLLSGGEDRSVRVWDLASLCQLANLEQAHLSGVFSVKQLDSGQFISAGRDRTLKVWLTSTWQLRSTLSPPHFDCVSDLVVAPRSGLFYSASRDRSIRKWDTSTFESDLQLTNAHGDWATSLAISSSELSIFSGSRDSVVKVWDQNLCCKDVLSGHRGGVSALLAVDNHLFSASHDRTVRVWRVDQFEHA